MKDLNEKSPAYLTLYREIRDDITSGTFSYGTKLPAKRAQQENTGLSLVTIEHAYDLLIDEGYIEARLRKGYYVCYRAGDMVSCGEKDHPSFPQLKQSGNTFPYRLMARTMRRVLSIYQERIMVKTEGAGALALREAIADYLARSRMMKAAPDQIVIGSGSEYLYSLIVQLLGRSKIYAVEKPCYEKIKVMYRANGVKLDELSMGKNGILSRELLRTKAAVLHVTPFRSFPSGASADASKRREYIQWAAARKAMIIEDDYDSEFARNGIVERTLFHLEPNSSVIYMNTFTETIAPSIRVGYMVLPRDKTDAYLKLLKGRSCTVPAFEQYVIAELLNSGSFERHINRQRRQRRRKQESS